MLHHERNSIFKCKQHTGCDSAFSCLCFSTPSRELTLQSELRRLYATSLYNGSKDAQLKAVSDRCDFLVTLLGNIGAFIATSNHKELDNT